MQPPDPSPLLYQVDAGVATITLNRPAVRNALGRAEWQALAAAVARAEADPTVRVVIVRGAGGTFCAGGDLKTMPERLALDEAERRRQLTEDAAAVLALYRLRKPTIAAIAGAAAGAGLSIALACDLRIAASSARLGAVFHKIGLTGDFGLLWLLPRVVGPARAIDLLYGAEMIDASRAEAIGLVSRVVAAEALDGEVAELARRLAAGPPLALAETKRALAQSLTLDLEAMLPIEAAAQARCSRTADAQEGVRAFLERRAPQCRGL